MTCLALAVQATEPTEPAEVPLNDSVASESVRSHRTQVKARKADKWDEQETLKMVNAEGDTLHLPSDTPLDSLTHVEMVVDSVVVDSAAMAAMGKRREFNPNPTTALWMSALCPGLGQVYNRRYWKIPIVVGAFVGLSYGTSWNNRMLQDYTRAYRDATDNDPETRSYMNFYPPTVKESDLDMAWLQKALKNKKDYFRRYRDICILAMVGVYALSIIDAYVDASLAHFDISPDLTMQVAPTVLNNQYTTSRTPSVGVQCAITF